MLVEDGIRTRVLPIARHSLKTRVNEQHEHRVVGTMVQDHGVASRKVALLTPRDGLPSISTPQDQPTPRG